MRLFVGIDIGDEMRQRAADLIAELRRAMPEVKWVSPESLHITLKFIGEQPESRLEEIGAALAAIPTPGPFDIAFRGVGCFPNERRPRVLFIDIEAPPELVQLAAATDAALASFGVEREKRAYNPHLTLARAREDGRPPRLGREWEAHKNEAFGRITATEFILYQSKLSPSGAQYAKLKRFALGEV